MARHKPNSILISIKNYDNRIENFIAIIKSYSRYKNVIWCNELAQYLFGATVKSKIENHTRILLRKILKNNNNIFNTSMIDEVEICLLVNVLLLSWITWVKLAFGHGFTGGSQAQFNPQTPTAVLLKHIRARL